MNHVTFGNRHLRPSKIVCIGKNYAAHIEEMRSQPSDLMTVFMKPNAAISDVLVAHREEPIHFEGEICLLIEEGRIAGIGFGLDLTKRATQAELKAALIDWTIGILFTLVAISIFGGVVWLIGKKNGNW